MAALTIKDSWLVDLLRDPVLAVYVIFGAEMDVSQRVGMRLMWHCPWFRDDSGVSVGKSERMFWWAALRCILLPNLRRHPRIVAVYYKNLNVAREVFWPKYEKYIETSPIFREQFARTRRGRDPGDFSPGDGSVLVRKYKNGARTVLPAGDFINDSSSQASKRFNDLGIDEVYEIDKVSQGINRQLISRATAPAYNSEHPLWANHICMMGHADDLLTHPGAKRVRDFRRLIVDGSQRHAEFTSCFRDIRPEFNAKYDLLKPDVIRAQRLMLTRSEFGQTWEGMWGVGGANWYGGEILQLCVDGMAGVRLHRLREPDKFADFLLSN